MSTVQRALALAAIAALSACVKSQQVDCMAGNVLCGGECVAVATDAANCGACGHACSASQICIAGGCETTCEGLLHAPIRDEWGYLWDGLERPRAPYRTARDACAAVGGRLPSVSEMYRVSAAGGGAVGDVHKTNALWAITPYDDATAYTFSMANSGTFGGVSSSGMTATAPYRCVCPAPRPEAFTEGACYGPAGAGCAALGGDARFNFDAVDRPNLGKSGAIYECALAGGELASAERLGAAASQGLPNGSGVWLHTGEDSGMFDDSNGGYYQDDVLVQFTGPSSWAVTYGGTGWAYYPRPFRCFGPASTRPGPAAVSNGFRDRRGKRTIDLGPDFVATTYSSAVADCFRRGGHLPTVTELVQLVEEGLPAFGYSGLRWTADQGYPGYAITFSWAGSSAWPDPQLAVTAPTADGVPYFWSATSTSHVRLDDPAGVRYRCVYYAVDPSYPAPTDNAQCSGTCFAVTPGTGTASPQPRTWFDGSTRVAATYYAAVATCAANGGRLASARDLLEAIRGRLDNAGAVIATSDLVGWLAAKTITGWSGTGNTGFVDTGSSYVGFAATVNYRCMWTNEIR